MAYDTRRFERPRGAAVLNAEATGDPVTTELLTVSGVTKRFGGVEALAGCSLSVDEGSITGLIGPNGAGKTTLFDVISGLTRADGGRIHLGADRLDGLSAHVIARRGIGRTFQIPRPLRRMTVLENMLVYAHHQAGEKLAHVFATPTRVAPRRPACASEPAPSSTPWSSGIWPRRGRKRSPAARRSCSSWHVPS
jgi:branched-chain amino acid transport system ATP-binding protein